MVFSKPSAGLDGVCVSAGLLQGLARLEELVRKVMDIVDNRVEANLQAIQRTLLVELPADRWVLHCSKCRLPSQLPVT
jgi:hypothetical protein